VFLLARVKAGEPGAHEELVRRFLPALMRWAHGRLPQGARDLLETQDLVQVTFVRALDHIEGFEPRWQGAFFAYLRRILMNQIRDEIRRVRRRPDREEISETLATDGSSPLEAALGSEVLDAYEEALGSLSEEQQQAVFMRVELGLTYQEIAEALGKNTMNAARMLVSRALVRLAEVLHERGIEPGNA
jgi:RNA polymerase sigma-70 factor (ECF subfamily)